MTYEMLEDHVLRGVFTLGDLRNPAYVRSRRPDSEVFPGSTVGTSLFNITAWPAQAAWINERVKACIGADFEFAMSEFAENDGYIVAEERMNTAVAIFADDCGSAASGFSAERVFGDDVADDKIFDDELGKAGVAQNMQEAV